MARPAGYTPTAGSIKKGKSVGKYVLVKQLGEGTYAKVWQGISKDTNEEYAIKCVQKAELVKQPQGQEQLYREIGVMKSLCGHRHIVELKEILQTGNNIYLVMEIAKGGELFEKISPNKGMPEEDGRRYFQQLISAMWFCHASGVAHRDIKPENLILSETGVLKVTDFGLSNLQKINDSGAVSSSLRLKTICGTPNYVAPEVISDTTMGYNGFQADVWSCGVVLYHLLAGHLPFTGTSVKEVLQKIAGAEPAECEHMSEGARDLICMLLTKDPTLRPSMKQIIEHEWFKVGFDASELEDRVEPVSPASPMM